MTEEKEHLDLATFCSFSASTVVLDPTLPSYISVHLWISLCELASAPYRQADTLWLHSLQGSQLQKVVALQKLPSSVKMS